MKQAIAGLMRLNRIYILLTIHCLFIWMSVLYYSYTMEDAYISFRYAENWATGAGLVFNLGEYVEGYTNFLWVIVLGSLHRLNLETLALAKGLGILCGLATLGATYKLGKYVTPTRDWTNFIAITLLALYPGFAIWAVAGLETLLFTLLITVGVWVSLKAVDEHRLNFGLIFALATLTRPEGVLIFGLALLNHFYWLIKQGVANRQVIISTLYNLTLFVLIVGTWEFWRWTYYGDLLPNTFYVKVAGQTENTPITQGFSYIIGFWNTIGGWFAFAFSCLVLISRSPKPWKMLFGFIVITWLLYIRQVNGDWMPWYRFFIPLLPLIFLSLQDAIAEIRQSASRIALILISAVLIAGFLTAIYTFRAEHRTLMAYGQDAVDTGRWLKDHATPHSTIAVTNAGAIPYYSGLRTLDYYGLLNSTISHFPLKTYSIDLGDGAVRDYQLRIDVDWLLDQQPDYFEIPGMLKPDGSLLTYAPLAQVIYSSQRFREEYETEPFFRLGLEMIFRRKQE